MIVGSTTINKQFRSKTAKSRSASTSRDEGDCSIVGKWPQSWAITLRDVASLALSQYRSLDFLDPYQTGIPEYKIVPDVTDLGNAHAALSCETYGTDITNTDQTPCVIDDLFVKMVTQHEMFHHIQLAYWHTFDDGYAGWGDWVVEGSARMMQDKLFADLDFTDYSFAGFHKEVNKALDQTETSLFDLSYRGCLFWTYVAERFGTGSEPSFGADFIRSFYEELAADGADGSSAAAESLNDVIQANGGGSLDHVWLDYAIANIAKDFDVSEVPDGQLYGYVDQNQGGEGGWDTVDRTTVSLPSNGSNSLEPYSTRYYELPLDSRGCTAVGFRGEADQEVGWALLALTTGDHVVGLSKGIGKEFGRSVLADPAKVKITRLIAVVAGLGDSTGFDYWFDQGTPTVTIYRPDMFHPTFINSNDSYRPFLTRVQVDGPANLKPDGVGPRSILGLHPDDFHVQLDTTDCTVVSAAYVGQYYWLVAAAPASLAQDTYDLTVSLCGDSLAAVNPNSVTIADVQFNHVLVIDQSGSMADPAVGQSKLEAAQVAAGLYADSVSPADRISLVSFNGNNVDCDDDATAQTSLKFADTTQKNLVGSKLGGLSATGWTSIGDGLYRGQNQLSATAVAAKDIWKMILLSDGDENEARYWSAVAGCSSASASILGTKTSIESIAFGPDSNQSLMQSIAASTGGDYSYVDVPAASFGPPKMSIANMLAEAYVDALQAARQYERFFYETDALSKSAEILIPISDDNLKDVIFFFNTASSADDLKVDLYDPSDVLVGAGLASIRTSPSHAVYRFNSAPVAGTYRAVLSTAGDSDYIAGVLGHNPSSPNLNVFLQAVPQGGAEGRQVCDFEQGVPVTILASVYDEFGVLPAADVTVRVTRPDGSSSCSPYRMFDDGAHNDGQAGDGLYGVIYSETALGHTGGVVNDPNGAVIPGMRGSYQVRVTAVGRANDGVEFSRIDDTSFQVCEVQDLDGDDLPDSWERYYGLDPFNSGDPDDPDLDGLTNGDEFKLGTNPFDSDTDGDGEMDGSEVNHGRCPTNPDDLTIPAPMDVAIDPNTSDAREPAPSNAITLRFAWHNTYAKLHIERAKGAGPFAALTTIAPTTETPIPCFYPDSDALVVGENYAYRFQAETFDGGLSRYSRTIATTFFPDCNGNGVEDGTDIANGTEKDCDENGVPDSCDIALFNAPDYDGDGVPDTCQCLGDLNHDGTVNLLDLGIVLSAYGQTTDGDIDADGDTDLSDLGVVLSGYGIPCP